MKSQTKIALILVLMVVVGTVSADSVFQTTNLLLGENGYITKVPSPGVTFGTSGITLTGIKLDNPSAQVAPPGGGLTISSFFDVWTEVSFTGALSGTYTIPVSPATVRYTNVYDVPPISQYATEMLSLNIGGPGFILRESPTLASIGGTTIGTVPGGFAIDSHFNVYLQLSTDGGLSWTEASSALSVSTIPEPATLLLIGLGGLLLRGKK
ncbi:MAG: PEP-CTERM sorting domain-containing protein [Phycisphaerae bacterium]